LVLFEVDEAIGLAMEHNKSILASEENIRAEEALAKNKLDLNKTNFGIQYGQYDGEATDFAFQINQSFAFPGYYVRKNQLANEEVRARELESDIQRNSLKRNIKTLWYELAITVEKQKYIRMQDSLLSEYLKATELRYEQQDATLLEKMTVETRYMENQNALQITEADIRIISNKLLMLINDSIVYQIMPVEFKISEVKDIDMQNGIMNPLIYRSQQEWQLAETRVKVENARMLPSFQIGYFNNSFVGSPLSDGSTATMSDRFDGLQAGISIPIFFQTQRSQIRYEKFRANMAKMQAEYTEEVLMSRYRDQISQVEKFRTSLEYYEQKALPQADMIISNAKKRFENEDLGYIEYLQSLQETIRLRLNYLETVSGYNNAVIELEYTKGNI
jgi:cobalt-zinc-cadmium resistance protein CzcA